MARFSFNTIRISQGCLSTQIRGKSAKYSTNAPPRLKIDVPTIKLNNGVRIPQVGFGLWKVTEHTANTVYNAIRAGYRLFDGAFDYGNEKEAGAGIKRAIDEGIVKREDLIIVSKLWNTFHEKERVEPITRQQLEWWGVNYFDIFYMHFPIALQYVDPKINYPSGWKNLDGRVQQTQATIQETWQAMEHLVDSGLTRSLGISNFQGSLLMDLLRYARIRPALLQVEIHPYLTQESLVEYAKSENIAVTAYSTFGPQSFVELKWDKAIDCPKLFNHSVITEIATAKNKTPAQVLLRWATQRGLAVIPKSTHTERLIQNLDCTSFDLTPAEMIRISGLNRNLRFNDPADVSTVWHLSARVLLIWLVQYLGSLYIFA